MAPQGKRDTSPSGTPDATDRNAAGVRFLAFLNERGGVLVAGQREIGRTMGWSKSWTNEVLHDLAAAGVVKLSTGKSGTVVRLVPEEFHDDGTVTAGRPHWVLMEDIIRDDVV